LDSMAIKMPGGWWSEAEPASGHHFTIILIHTRGLLGALAPVIQS